MPAGMKYSIPFDTTPFVKVSIEKVIYTFIEAMVLVFLVMYLFLQNVRYTFIPGHCGAHRVTRDVYRDADWRDSRSTY